MAGYIPRWYTRRKTVTHPSTNLARRGLTSFMRRTPLTTTPRRQPGCLKKRRHVARQRCNCATLLTLTSINVVDFFLNSFTVSPGSHMGSQCYLPPGRGDIGCIARIVTDRLLIMYGILLQRLFLCFSSQLCTVDNGIFNMADVNFLLQN